MSIKFGEWFKLGVVQGLIEVALVALLVTLGVSSLLGAGDGVGLIAGIIGAAFIVLLAILTLVGGLFTMAGRWLYGVLKLKLSIFWKIWFATTVPGIIMSILRTGFSVSEIAFLAIFGMGFTWATIKVYKQLKWRLPQ